MTAYLRQHLTTKGIRPISESQLDVFFYDIALWRGTEIICYIECDGPFHTSRFRGRGTLDLKSRIKTDYADQKAGKPVVHIDKEDF